MALDMIRIMLDLLYSFSDFAFLLLWSEATVLVLMNALDAVILLFDVIKSLSNV